MKLNVLERLLLLNILPQEESRVTMKIVGELKNDLGFSEEEYKKYKFVEKEGKTTWNPVVEQFKEVHVGEKATDIVVEALERIDKDKKVTAAHESLYQKFVDKK